MPVAKPMKPKGVRKRGGSAVDGLVNDVLAGKATPGQYVALSAITVALLAVAGGAYYVLRSRVVALSPTDSAALKEVFFSGEPWLVECIKKTSTRASPMFRDAEGSLTGLKMGTLDCGAVLPSGKSTYERFRLKEPSYGPVVLAAANSERPQIAPRNVLSSGAALAEWSLGATKAKAFSPASMTQFDSQCLRKPWCLVVLTATGRLNDAERAALADLTAAERRVRVVKVDQSKSNLMLDLPGGGMPAPSAGAATVMLLKTLEKSAADPPASPPSGEGEGDGDGDDEEAVDANAPPVAASLLSSGLLDVGGTRGAIAAALASTDMVPNTFSKLAKRPSLRPKRQPPPATPPYDASRRSSPSTPEPASKTLTDAELKAMREERAKLIKEAEQQRRQKMAAEEASAANIVEEVDGSTGEGEGESEGGGGSPFADDGDEDGDEGGGAAEETEEVEAEEFD